jgi:uncharacterized protein
MRRNLLMSLLVAPLAFIAMPALSAEKEDIDDLPSITVMGSGQISVRPDMAQINMGVTTQSATAQAALTANNAAMAALLKALAARGIAEKDILTSNFSIYPEYRQPGEPGFPSSGGKTAKIVSYRVNNEVQVRVRKIASLGPLLDEVVKVGSNQVQGINFMIDEPSPVLDEARKKALADARRKAEVYATTAGIKLGRVLSIDESVQQSPRPMMEYARAEMAQSSVPIAAGEQQLSAHITVKYAIE